MDVSAKDDSAELTSTSAGQTSSHSRSRLHMCVSIDGRIIDIRTRECRFGTSTRARFESAPASRVHAVLPVSGLYEPIGHS